MTAYSQGILCSLWVGQLFNKFCYFFPHHRFWLSPARTTTLSNDVVHIIDQLDKNIFCPRKKQAPNPMNVVPAYRSPLL